MIDNSKNELHYIINDAGLNDSGLLNGWLYIDANNAWEYLTLKLIFIVINYKQVVALSQNLDLSILTYKNNGYLISLNDW